MYASNPLDACSPLLNVSTPGKGSAPAFLLVQRGVCNFEIKVRLAQEAGFAAVIVYNDQDDRELVTSKSAFTPILRHPRSRNLFRCFRYYNVVSCFNSI